MVLAVSPSRCSAYKRFSQVALSNALRTCLKLRNRESMLLRSLRLAVTVLSHCGTGQDFDQAPVKVLGKSM
jgi:hypothetical protein